MLPASDKSPSGSERQKSPSHGSTNKLDLALGSGGTLGTIAHVPQLPAGHIAAAPHVDAQPAAPVAKTVSSPAAPQTTAKKAVHSTSSIMTGHTPLRTTPGGSSSPVRLSLAELVAKTSEDIDRNLIDPEAKQAMHTQISDPHHQHQHQQHDHQQQQQQQHRKASHSDSAARPDSIKSASPARTSPATSSSQNIAVIDQHAIKKQPLRPNAQLIHTILPGKHVHGKSIHLKSTTRASSSLAGDDSVSWSYYLFLGVFIVVLIILIVVLVITKAHKMERIRELLKE